MWGDDAIRRFVVDPWVKRGSEAFRGGKKGETSGYENNLLKKQLSATSIVLVVQVGKRYRKYLFVTAIWIY